MEGAREEQKWWNFSTIIITIIKRSTHTICLSLVSFLSQYHFCVSMSKCLLLFSLLQQHIHCNNNNPKKLKKQKIKITRCGQWIQDCQKEDAYFRLCRQSAAYPMKRAQTAPAGTHRSEKKNTKNERKTKCSK